MLIKHVLCVVLLFAVVHQTQAQNINFLTLIINALNALVTAVLTAIINAIVAAILGLINNATPPPVTDAPLTTTTLDTSMYDSVVFIPGQGYVGGNINPQTTQYPFKAILYANPVSRFQRALPKSNWSTIYDATAEPSVCPQADPNGYFTGLFDEENCLLLTVTTGQDPNSIPTDALKPVVVFFYDGNIFPGTIRSDWYNPSKLVAQDLIVVQVQYRQSIFGFMNDGVNIAKNLGLRDSLLAARWVKQNIAAFGGDPGRITAYGHGFGAAIVSHLWQSPLAGSEALFQQLILQSGSSVHPWSFQNDSAGNLQILGDYLNCADPDTLYECLLATPLEDMVNMLGLLQGIEVPLYQFLNGYVAAIVLEDDESDSTRIVTQEPYASLQSGAYDRDVKLLTTITNQEMRNFEEYFSALRFWLDQNMAPLGMNIKDPDNAGVKIKEHYSSVAWGYAADVDLRNYLGDVAFNNAWQKFIELIYLLNGLSLEMFAGQFSYVSSLGTTNSTTDVGDGDDLYYIWGLPTLNQEVQKRANGEIPARADEMSEQMVKFYANFITAGTPTPVVDPNLNDFVWPVVDNSVNFSCADLNDAFTVVESPKNNDYSFWNALESVPAPRTF